MCTVSEEKIHVKENNHETHNRQSYHVSVYDGDQYGNGNQCYFSICGRDGRMSYYMFFVLCFFVTSLIGNVYLLGEVDKLEHEVKRLRGKDNDGK